MHFAFRTPCLAGRGANGIARLLHQQGLIATDKIDRREIFLQMGAELFRLNLHR